MNTQNKKKLDECTWLPIISQLHTRAAMLGTILYHTTSLQCFKVLAATLRDNACVTYCFNLSSPCSHQECVEIWMATKPKTQ